MEITVIGLGLIGGSLMRALAAAGHSVTGFDTDPVTREVAAGTSRMHILDAARRRWEASSGGGSSHGTPDGGTHRPGHFSIAPNVAAAVDRAQLVVIAVPLPGVESVVDSLAEAGYSGLVTDVTSVKEPVRHLVDTRLAARTGARFVGGHPMAGKETSGFHSADPDLFDGCAWVLCVEQEGTRPADWLAVAEVVLSLGARPVPCTAREHDRAVARISHVPHLVAAALTLGALDDPLALALGAGSFRDGTRVAATRPELVAAMCGGNAEAVGQALDELIEQLALARQALDEPDPVEALPSWLAPAHRVRKGWRACGERAATAPVMVEATPQALLALGRAGGRVVSVDPGPSSRVGVEYPTRPPSGASGASKDSPARARHT